MDNKELFRNLKDAKEKLKNAAEYKKQCLEEFQKRIGNRYGKTAIYKAERIEDEPK